MELEYIRDYAMYAAIFGVFASAWFGWAQENPPESWRPFLGAGSILSLIVAGIGIYMAIKFWGSGSALETNDSYAMFGLVVGIEVALILAGSLILMATKKSGFVSSWIAFIVAIHFAPLAFLFEDMWLWLLTALAVVASVLPLFIHKSLNVTSVTLTGIFMGLVLLAFAARGLVLFFLNK